MNEHPILFNGEMVRAILEGRKIQTRRIVKIQPPSSSCQVSTLIESTAREDRKKEGKLHWVKLSPDGLNIIYNQEKYFKCPWQVGDRLWVREKTRLIASINDSYEKVRFRYEADGLESDWLTYPDRLAPLELGNCVPNGCYREASRINLIIDGIQCERLQDITPTDCEAEGIKLTEEELKSCNSAQKYRSKYHSLWNSIYGQWQGIYKRVNGRRQLIGFECYPWVEGDAPSIPEKARKLDLPCTIIENPWLWVIEFHQETANETKP